MGWAGLGWAPASRQAAPQDSEAGLTHLQLTPWLQVFVREASMVPVYSLLLFGGQLEVLHDKAGAAHGGRLVCNDPIREHQARSLELT